jgi:hypothetical protein
MFGSNGFFFLITLSKLFCSSSFSIANFMYHIIVFSYKFLIF